MVLYSWGFHDGVIEDKSSRLEYNYWRIMVCEVNLETTATSEKACLLFCWLFLRGCFIYLHMSNSKVTTQLSTNSIKISLLCYFLSSHPSGWSHLYWTLNSEESHSLHLIQTCACSSTSILTYFFLSYSCLLKWYHRAQNTTFKYNNTLICLDNFYRTQNTQAVRFGCPFIQVKQSWSSP